MQLRDLLILGAPYRAQLVWLALLSLVGSLVTLAIPALGARLLGGFLGEQGPLTGQIGALLAAAIVATTLVTFATTLFSGNTSARLLADLRRHVYRHVQALPLDYHDNHRQGDTLALMTYEVGNLSQFLTATLTSVPSRLLTAGGAAIILLTIDPLLAAIVPLAVPAFYLVLKLIGRRLRGLAQSIQEAEA
jgi:ATP-binding cassette subfamily B protein